MEKPYPTSEQLNKIKKWDILRDVNGLLDYIQLLWQYDDFFILKGKNIKRLELHTGGWSGNEFIIYALQNNENLFWPLYWEKSIRGGHYYFKIKPIK